MARTEGNALFIRELVELLATDDRLGMALPDRLEAVPQGLQAVVRRRVSRLDPSTQQLLSIAAVLGQDLDVDVVADVAGIEPDAARHALASAVTWELVTATAEVVGLRFSHARRGRRAGREVNPARRTDLHAAAARSLARRRPGDEHAALVAHHASRGAAAGTASLAVTAGTQAARAAMARFAPADAARSWAVVVDALERSQPEDRVARLDALVEMGRAHEQADEMVGAQRSAMEAMRLAMEVGDAERLGAAASVLSHASIFPNRAYGQVDLDLVSVLGEALESLPDEDSPSRVYVLAALATELVDSPDVERRDRASGEALDQARRLGQPALVAARAPRPHVHAEATGGCRDPASGRGRDGRAGRDRAAR